VVITNTASACSTGDVGIVLSNGEVWNCTASAWVDSSYTFKGVSGSNGLNASEELQGAPCKNGIYTSEITVSTDQAGTKLATCAPEGDFSATSDQAGGGVDSVVNFTNPSLNYVFPGDGTTFHFFPGDAVTITMTVSQNDDTFSCPGNPSTEVVGNGSYSCSFRVPTSFSTWPLITNNVPN